MDAISAIYASFQPPIFCYMSSYFQQWVTRLNGVPVVRPVFVGVVGGWRSGEPGLQGVAVPSARFKPDGAAVTGSLGDQ